MQLPPLAASKFFVVMYEQNHSMRYLIVNKKVFTNYNEALAARNYNFPFTDSFLRGFDTKEEAELFISQHEIEAA